MRSAEFFRAKARWYRDLARREVGVDQEKLLATARDFDDKAEHRATWQADNDVRIAAAARLRRHGVVRR
jgi:hypothetical protein